MNGDKRDADTISRILTSWMQSAFADVFKESGGDFSDIKVVPAANPDFGDFQCNDAMQLAKVLKKKPRDIAQAVADGAKPHESLARIEVAGPGFLNLHLNNEWLARYLESMAGSDRVGVPAVGENRTIVIDYSSPNVAKPMHIGHIRSTNIGSALDRMFRFLGYHVISDNHLGDWGTQFGIIIMGYRNFLDKAALEKDPIAELERIYVKSYEKTKTDESWLDQCRKELVKLQAGDAANVALWKQFVALSLKEFDVIYRRFGVKFDLVRGESFYNDRLGPLVARLEQQGIARESEGATVVFLDDEKLPPCIVRKSDGAFNYATTDMATIETRISEFRPERIVYVTDERQQLHFRQVFAACRRLGHVTRCDHVWFGLMRLPEGTFSTREGNVIKLEKLLDEAEARALKIVQETSPEMDPARQREVARAVGIGAVKYADLSQNPQTTVIFTWEKALSMEGNSAPYLQYAYARISSVRDKYTERFPAQNPDSFPIQITEDIERTLAVKLTRFPEIVIQAADTYRPSSLADYLYDISQTYSTFYQNVPFLRAPDGVRESRVRLCGVVAKVLGTGLHLLGIDTPERV